MGTSDGWWDEQTHDYIRRCLVAVVSRASDIPPEQEQALEGANAAPKE